MWLDYKMTTTEWRKRDKKSQINGENKVTQFSSKFSPTSAKEQEKSNSAKLELDSEHNTRKVK